MRVGNIYIYSDFIIIKMVKKILIVDDEPDFLKSIKMFIKTIGYSVKTASNGFDALNILKKEKFDLVLLDMLMPEMSGKEVLEKIRADPKLKNQKVAFLTVVSLTDFGEKIIKELHPADYIDKTMNLPELKKRLGNLLK